MNIVFITYNFSPISCGVGDYSNNLALQFQKEGHQLFIICGKQVAREAFIQSGFQILPILEKGKLNRLKEAIVALNADLVLVQYVPGGLSKWSIPFSLVQLVCALRSKKVQVAIMFHEIRVRFSFDLKRLMLAFFQQMVAILLCRFANNIITSIPHYQKILKPWRKNISVIPIGSNIPEVHFHASELGILRNRYAKPEEKIICTFHLRDQLALLALFEEFRKEYKAVKLLIIGKTYKAQTSDNRDIIFTGFLSGEEVRKHLLISNVFILPEYVGLKGDGGLCNKSGSLAAAIGAGLPIIGTKGDMTSDLLTNSGAVFYMNDKGVDLNILLSTLLKNNDKIVHASEASKRFYINYLSWEAIYAKFKKELNINSIKSL